MLNIFGLCCFDNNFTFTSLPVFTCSPNPIFRTMNLFSFKQFWLFGMALCFVFNTLSAQEASRPREIALRYLRTHAAAFNLSPQDVSEVRVTDEYVTRHNGLTHVWIQQMHLGSPVNNGLIGLHVRPNGEVLHLGHRFVPNLASRVNTTLPSLSAAKAVDMAKMHLGFQGFATPAVREKINERNWVFEAGAISRAPISVSATYFAGDQSTVRLAWKVVIDQPNTPDVWSLFVDAQTGEILDKYNHTLYCKAGNLHAAHEACTEEHLEAPNEPAVPQTTGASGSYRVFALPVESPAHGPQTLVTNPHDPTASPFGWHDTDAAPGAEYTIPRGNNVFAYEDTDNNNAPPNSPGPDGGAALVFDYPYEANQEPIVNQDAAIVNLFYMNNMLHDITYRFGFDEVAGNFQANNYGRGGLGGDYVVAEAQDGSGVDNANFSTPPDGGNGRMQMYVWGGQGGNLVTVNAPVAVTGPYEAAGASGWGAILTTTPVTGDVEIVDDGTSSPTLGCESIVNNVAGKIALVDRQLCEFGLKALNAQNAGAIACIICNFEDAVNNMGPGAVGAQVTIPVVSMAKGDCDLIRAFVGQGLNVSIALPSSNGPNELDGDFDNGIIAHEFGHGISNRLTGGPAQNGCLQNAEQMGEGWSDYFTLITTVKPGDTAEKRRGVGTFVQRQSNAGVGIRRYPYSADMSVSPVSFSTVAQNTGVHAIGEVWAATNWDLYWAMVEKYGYDADLTNPNSGNARAVQLVMDGMKLQPCSPGFIDGRDAIMLADIINNNGEDTCLISSVFARRGMGIFASQGSNTSAVDQVEDFNPIPTCIRELKITKSGTPLVTPGDNAEYTLTVTNHKGDTAENVVVTDEMPPGATLVDASNGGIQSGNMVVWNLGDMPYLQVRALTYTVKTDPSIGSLPVFNDDLENDFDWNSAGSDLFVLQNQEVKVGNFAWKANGKETESDFYLLNLFPISISGANPVMRFWHQYNTELGNDAGFIEVQEEGKTEWKRFAEDKLFREPYNSPVSYSSIAIAFLRGFSGNSNGWVQSYVDMSEYAGKNVYVRFRFVSNASVAPANGGWIVDGFELIDMYNVNTEACVTSSDGGQACASMAQRGTIFNAATTSADNPAHNTTSGLRVQPNPSSDVFFVSSLRAVEGVSQLQLFSTDGRLVWQRSVQNLAEGQTITVNVEGFAPGIYMLRLDNPSGAVVEKVIVY
jgi:uncharacterized repeat protein (TIGR01451 family)